MSDIETIKKEYQKLLEQLANPELVSNWEKGEALLKRKSFLEEALEKDRQIEELKKKIEENKIIISAKEDLELTSLAQTETIELQQREKELEKELERLIQEEVPESQNLLKAHTQKAGGQAVIVEVRAGVGGEEATLFVADLFKMYSKYAQIQGWKQKTFDSNPTEIGGFKEIIFELTPHQGRGGGGDVFSKMKYEAGVHRVQRIPQTEKSGRVHTSTVSVAVLPKPKKSEIKIRPEDIKTDVYAASGPGGQYVNKRQTAVRITHLPTGIVVTCQTERNLHQNKENALSILEARLWEKKETQEKQQLSKQRKSQIGLAKRAEKIRTYNFPQDRLTDHRIKKSWHNIAKILNGELNPIIESLEKTSPEAEG